MNKTVVVAVLVIMALGIAAYFVSDVFKTKVDTAYNQFAHWTPENIADDTAGYLRFCESATVTALEDLKASEIAISQKRAQILNMRESAQKKVDVGTGALSELKSIFRKAENTDAWPASWRDQLRDKEWTQRQIVSLHAQVQSQRAVAQKCEGATRKLDTQTKRVQKVRTDAQQQLAEIKANQEMLAVDQLTEDLADRLVSIKSAIQTTVDTASDVSGVISLDDLASEADADFDQASFDSIMEGE